MGPESERPGSSESVQPDDVPSSDTTTSAAASTDLTVSEAGSTEAAEQGDAPTATPAPAEDAAETVPAAATEPAPTAAPETVPTAAAEPAPEVPAAAAVAAEAVPPATALPPAASVSGWQAPSEPIGPFPGLKFADHGKRLVSYILDVIIASLLTIVVAIGFGALTAVFVSADLDLLAVLSGISLFLSVFLVSLVYWPYFWVHGGVTPGMRMVGGLRVVMDRDGGPVTVGPAVLRLIGYWIDALVFYLGFIWILIDSRRRGWHDLIAGTVVVQEE